jgi:hypothetical protein
VDYIELEKKILRGKELFSEIIRLTTDFLDRFDDLSPAEIHSFEQTRRELLDVLIRFYSDFRSQLPDEKREIPLDMTKKLEELRIFQEVFVQIIMGKGAEIVSRATNLKDLLKRDMAVINSGKNALRGYDGRRGLSPSSLNKTV